MTNAQVTRQFTAGVALLIGGVAIALTAADWYGPVGGIIAGFGFALAARASEIQYRRRAAGEWSAR